jgi:crossover junction endodeoxyribonuclease RuvC
MILIGLDPGLATTGYAVIKKEAGGTIQALDWGIIETKKNQNLPDRLKIVSSDLTALIRKYRPTLAVVETLYFAKNAKTAIAVAQARGVLLLTLAQKKIKILEITPLQVKSRITGYGNASKTQVQCMITKLLKLTRAPKPDDAADALALAWCGLSKSL